jgi:hypothetical protein
LRHGLRRVSRHRYPNHIDPGQQQSLEKAATKVGANIEGHTRLLIDDLNGSAFQGQTRLAVADNSLKSSSDSVLSFAFRKTQDQQQANER